MRSPLDKACDDQRDAFQESISEAHKLGFKTGADWQLKQCLEYLRTHPFHDRDDYENLCAYSYSNLLEEAMRPTQGEHLQDEAVNKFIKNNSAALTELADS